MARVTGLNGLVALFIVFGLLMIAGPMIFGFALAKSFGHIDQTAWLWAILAGSVPFIMVQLNGITSHPEEPRIQNPHPADVGVHQNTELSAR